MVKEIIVGTGRKKVVTLVDDEIYESLHNGPITVTLTPHLGVQDSKGGYVNITFNLSLHRYVWEYFNGSIPEGMHVDHINENPSDNRKENLRLMLRSEHQSMHVRKRFLKAKGYTKIHTGKFVVHIVVNGRTKHVGTFGTEEEASQAYQQAKIERDNISLKTP